ncbi:hypothetical protein ZOSMA_21G00900 [Zostera marina]|uniref:Secreted protein n=1 Tax=Zostera marina TaxID=29655 RepID=A0A0K9PJV0_ZOSMR|nr:hypothetical protein ZOSMA_21G00900 [Zostera marina]
MGGKEIAVLLILTVPCFFSSGATESTDFADNPPAPAPEHLTLKCCLWGFGREASLWRRPRICKSWCWKPKPHQLVIASAPAPVSVLVPSPAPSPAGHKRLKCCLWEFKDEASLWRRRRVCTLLCYD